MQRHQQVTVTVEAAFGDQTDSALSLRDVLLGGSRQQAMQICEILWARNIVSGQQFERDEVASSRDRQRQPGHDLQVLCGPHDLGLNSRTGEQDVDQDRYVIDP